MHRLPSFSRQISRRQAVCQAGLAGFGAWGLSAVSRASADTSLAVGLIGCGPQGRSVAKAMGLVPGVRVAAVVDPDAERRGRVATELDAADAGPDLRRLLDDPGIEAVIVATPDHWHAPASILACDAGKHVYVEKPCSHTLHEAGLLRDVARRRGVVVQHGTQSRSNPIVADAVRLVRQGAIGDVLVARAWNVQRRSDIGRRQPGTPPRGVDYDLWIGPAPFLPFQENRFHYNWRWWHAFGCGDVGNDGTHELDYARWGLGIDTLPARVAGLGGKSFFRDDQEFPDTATLVFDFPGAGPSDRPRQLVFEMRLWSGNYPHNCDSGVEFHGTDGMLFVSKRGKLEILDGGNKRREPPKASEPVAIGSHQADFVAAIRAGHAPRADMDEAFRSVALVHLGNIAIRLGRALQPEPDGTRISGDDEATAMLRRDYREGHWAIPAGPT
jgi:predicted dehydrogenase